MGRPKKTEERKKVLPTFAQHVKKPTHSAAATPPRQQQYFTQYFNKILATCQCLTTPPPPSPTSPRLPCLPACKQKAEKRLCSSVQICRIATARDGERQRESEKERKKRLRLCTEQQANSGRERRSRKAAREKAAETFHFTTH